MCVVKSCLNRRDASHSLNLSIRGNISALLLSSPLLSSSASSVASFSGFLMMNLLDGGGGGGGVDVVVVFISIPNFLAALAHVLFISLLKKSLISVMYFMVSAKLRFERFCPVETTTKNNNNNKN